MRGTSGNLVWILCAAGALFGCSRQTVYVIARADAGEAYTGGQASVGTGGRAGLDTGGTAGLGTGGRAGLGTGGQISPGTGGSAGLGTGGQVSPGAGGSADGGADGSAADGAASGCIDFSQLSTPTVSFERDVMPIFGLSCIASTCHDAASKKAGLILGDHSACGPPGTVCYDPAAKWKFTYKAGIPRDLLTAVYAGLVNTPSRIVPAVKLVAPGYPSASFLLDTVMGTQNSNWYTSQCVNTDPNIAPGACGGDMPLGSPNWCADGDPFGVQRVQALAQWIAQGAQMN